MRLALGFIVVGFAGLLRAEEPPFLIKGLENVAAVTRSYLVPGETVPQYILIQDIHQNPECQGLISRAILWGYENWGVRRVFMEGAFSPVDLSVFHRLPDDERQTLLTRLVSEGNLSGPEMAAVLLMEREWRRAPVSPFQLIGMESPRLYAANLQAFKQVYATRAEALRELGSLRRLQERLELPQENILDAQLRRAEKLLQLKLTPADYALYLSARDLLPASAQLTPALQNAERFYELVNERSVAFIREAGRKLPAGGGPRVLVAGGFHTDFMADLLRTQNKSFIVLSPKTKSGVVTSAYEKQLLQSVDTLQFPKP